jgi:hypothetical protein
MREGGTSIQFPRCELVAISPRIPASNGQLFVWRRRESCTAHACRPSRLTARPLTKPERHREEYCLELPNQMLACVFSMPTTVL